MSTFWPLSFDTTSSFRLQCLFLLLTFSFLLFPLVVTPLKQMLISCKRKKGLVKLFVFDHRKQLKIEVLSDTPEKELSDNGLSKLGGFLWGGEGALHCKWKPILKISQGK